MNPKIRTSSTVVRATLLLVFGLMFLSCAKPCDELVVEGENCLHGFARKDPTSSVCARRCKADDDCRKCKDTLEQGACEPDSQTWKCENGFCQGECRVPSIF